MLSAKFSEALEECLGAVWKDYVANKRRGGDSGRKGVQYEDTYCAYQLSRLLCCLATGNDVGDATLDLQAEAVVDDLVIIESEVTRYFQCKNASKVSWEAGKHPIKDDFSAQMCLALHQGAQASASNKKQVKTILTVSSPALADTLSKNIPDSIADHAEVDYFPYFDGSLNRLVLEFDALREQLSTLAKHDNPADDQLEAVLGALMLGIRKRNGQGSVQEMLQAAQAVSPHLIRLMPSQVAEFKLIDGVEELLAQIPGLNYDLSRGFFSWKAFGTSGTLPYSCLDEQFGRFQRRLLDLKPSTFDAFEGLL